MIECNLAQDFPPSELEALHEQYGEMATLETMTYTITNFTDDRFDAEEFDYEGMEQKFARLPV